MTTIGRLQLPLSWPQLAWHTVNPTSILVGALFLSACGLIPTSAPQPKPPPRIAFLSIRDPEETVAINELAAFRDRMREHGYIERDHFTLDVRYASGREDRLPDLAAEFVRSKVDVIVARGTPETLAAKNATSTIPIVMGFASDPVGTGLVASLARPGAT